MELAGALPVVCPHTGPARRVATARVARYCVGCYPPREIVIATSAPPRNTIARPIPNGRWPVWRPNAYPVRNSIAIAIPFEARKANRASLITANGITTGNVANTTIRNTPRAPSQSSFRSCGRDGRLGNRINPSRKCSISAEDMTDTTKGGSASAMIWCASAGLATCRNALSLRIP